jgi:RNA polymerase sigma factor FliA
MAVTQEQQLWTDYRCGIAAAREQLLEKYMPFAKHLAASLYAKRAVNDIEFGDYLHLAYLGLFEAMQRYRDDSSAQFATFASYRIRGSVLNGIPQMTEIGDQIAYAQRVQRERTESLLAQGKAPSQLADLLNLVIELALIHQIDELLEADEPNLRSPYEPYGSHAYGEMQQRLKTVLAQLPERERKIIQYHYFHQVTFDEIAKLFGIANSRVNQLHKRALELIRQTLQQTRFSECY